MNLSDLTHGAPVRYRLGRAGKNDVNWGPWVMGPLFIDRRETDLPKSLRKRCRYWKAGDITTMSPINEGWADYSQDDYVGDGIFQAEDYYMQIEGLTQGT